MAVGSAFQIHLGTSVTLSEAWDGRSWALQPTGNPNGAAQSILSAVSCTSRRSCVAVGHASSAQGVQVPLAETWDGRTWTVQPITGPIGSSDSALSGVSCASKRSCIAVGQSVAASGVVTLAESWDGTQWRAQPTPIPAETHNDDLLGVSCTSKTACTAVGVAALVSNGQNLPLAESWDGRVWSVQPTPIPTGSSDTVLQGVSCTSKNACTAVGDTSNLATPPVTVAEAWNGTAWTVQPTPHPGLESVLLGASCTSRTTCAAVGEFFPTNVNFAALAEHHT